MYNAVPIRLYNTQLYQKPQKNVDFTLVYFWMNSGGCIIDEKRQ